MILRSLVILVVLALVAPAAHACGERIVALRELTAEAPVIALVTVVGQTPAGALIRVDEMLKGGGAEGIGREVVVRHASAQTGTAVLAFLQFDDSVRSWCPTSWFYGWKTLGKAGKREAYLERVREALALETISDAADRGRETVEWLVRCIEDPATRWEGAYDLAFGAAAGASLTPEQYRRVVEVLTSGDTTEGLLELASRGGDPRVAVWALERLRSGDPRTWGLMNAAAEVLAWGRGRTLVDAFGSSSEAAEREAYLAAFVSELEAELAAREVFARR